MCCTLSMFHVSSRIIANTSEYKNVAEYYSGVIMSAIASQITSVSVVSSTVCSGADQRKHHSSALLACEGNPPVTDGFSLQRASNTENVSIWRRHYGSQTSDIEHMEVCIFKINGIFHWYFLFRVHKLASFAIAEANLTIFHYIQLQVHILYW